MNDARPAASKRRWRRMGYARRHRLPGGGGPGGRGANALAGGVRGTREINAAVRCRWAASVGRRSRAQELPRELRSRSDFELGVDAREVTFDGLLAQEQRGRNLAVRATPGDEFGDTSLRRRQSVLARAAANPPELPLRPLDPARSAERLEPGERLGERLARRPLLPAASQDACEREERTGTSEGISGGSVSR